MEYQSRTQGVRSSEECSIRKTFGGIGRVKIPKEKYYPEQHSCDGSGWIKNRTAMIYNGYT